MCWYWFQGNFFVSQIFGAFSTHPFRVSEHCYGTGETFLYSFCPEIQVCAELILAVAMFIFLSSNGKFRHHLLSISRCTAGQGTILTLWKAIWTLCRWEEEGKYITLSPCFRSSTTDLLLPSVVSQHPPYLSLLCSGQLGLWLDAELYRGTTTKCATFNNQPLSTRQDFTVHSLEVWTFE